MNFRFLSHLPRALALVLLIGAVGVLSMGNAVWASPSESKKPPKSTVPKKEADLSIKKTARPVGNDDFIFTITVTNNGPIAAEKVIVTDSLSKHFELEYVHVLSGGFSCSGERTIMCKKATLGAGQSAIIEIRVDVEPDNFRGSITNTASVSSKTKDPNSKNNKSSVKVQAKGRR